LIGPVQSILILQTKFIGDLVLSSVLAKNLELEYPGARITFFCAAGFETFLTSDGIAAEAISFRRSRMRGTPAERGQELYTAVRKLRRSRFDLAIDLTDSRTSRFILRMVSARTKIAYDPPEKPLGRWERQPANCLAKANGSGGRHYLHRYLAPLDALGMPVRVRFPSIHPSPGQTGEADTLLGRHGLGPGSFIAIHAGASVKGRCWPPERFATAIDDISRRAGLACALVGGPDEQELALSVMQASRSPVVNLVGAMSLEILLAVLERARLFLGNESGPMHMAAAAGTPVVGLFGLTEPSRWGPVGVPNIVVQPSMPCECIAPGICQPPNVSKVCCVWRLDVASVVDAVCELLSRTRPTRISPETGYPADPGVR